MHYVLLSVLAPSRATLQAAPSNRLPCHRPHSAEWIGERPRWTTLSCGYGIAAKPPPSNPSTWWEGRLFPSAQRLALFKRIIPRLEKGGKRRKSPAIGNAARWAALPHRSLGPCSPRTRATRPWPERSRAAANGGDRSGSTSANAGAVSSSGAVLFPGRRQPSIGKERPSGYSLDYKWIFS